ncbi:phospholipase D-like domain-containing protein [Paraburkholderia adhaesiva]|uniref:phospholipase D-like domain-containing protein n=1 Tax=Paraburkholderia adhaesiva TaxID=2883244 RepID=UPI001F28DFA0|nr:phospholipase D-like domain-containing protein [Paraburkholderia adhaesiva]
MSDLKTQNPVDVAIAEAGRQAQGSVQWLLEKKTCPDAPETTEGNDLKLFYCGQQGFDQLSSDLLDAKSSVDLICWGFDPGMELGRGSGPWPRGMRYGDVLEQLAKDGKKVRLLLWFHPRASRKQNSMPGYTDVPVNAFTSPVQRAVQGDDPYGNKARHEWCKAWWARHGVTHDRVDPRKATYPDHLQIVLRGIDTNAVKELLAADIKEEDPPDSSWLNPTDEAALLWNYPTHHQKPVLIDYAHDGGSKAVGFVMGLNSVTDYWDTVEHEIETDLRETGTTSTRQAETDHEYKSDFPYGNPDDREKLAAIHGGDYKSIRPYQDYACRVVGPALKRLHQNFENGWNMFAPSQWKTSAKDSDPLPPKIPTLEKDPAQQVQIVRTQAAENEKTIKRLYFQATSVARNYIYIENQYFFYPEFARHLKKERKKFCRAWAKLAKKPMTKVPNLHLFIVTPHPEDDGMVPRTFDTLTEFGKSDAMPAQAGYVDAGKSDQKYANSTQGTYTTTYDDDTGNPHSVARTHPVLDRPSVDTLENTMGLKVSVVRLCTSGSVGGKMAYREIYIHSKLMIIDDAFFTLGSANLNQRSMSVDSEINIAATGADHATTLRGDVFRLHSGGDINGDGGRSGMPDVYKSWDDRASKNFDKWKAGKEKMNGFLMKFEDQRSTSTKHAMNTVPSSADSQSALV